MTPKGKSPRDTTVISRRVKPSLGGQNLKHGKFDESCTQAVTQKEHEYLQEEKLTETDVEGKHLLKHPNRATRDNYVLPEPVGSSSITKTLQSLIKK